MTSPRRSTTPGVVVEGISKRGPRGSRTKTPRSKAVSRRSLNSLTHPISKPRTTKPGNPSLLSLPDEPLTQIISHLSELTPSLRPPPAFFLAQTNSRLLRIFRSQLTRITPYTDNNTPTTLSCEHLAALSRLAGEHLRAIHLPKGALWPELADHCPNVEELVFRDDWCSHPYVSHIFERLPLKVLEVVQPCPETLQMIHESPFRLHKLVLKHISLSNIDPLLLVMKSKPREMVLDFEFILPRDNDEVLRALEDTVQNIEKLSINAPPMPETPDEGIETIVKRLRESGRKRICKDIHLGGAGIFHLLRQVDSNAKVALEDHGYALRSDAPGEKVYVTRLASYRFDPHVPKFDISRLEELMIVSSRYPGWIEHLPLLKHVETPLLEMLPVRAEIVTIMIPTRPCKEVQNYPTRELRFRGRRLFANEIIGVCEAIQIVLSRFKGKTVWMEFIAQYDLPEDRDALRPHIRSAKYACSSFEQRGGDAGTVLAWLDAVFSRCF